MNAILSPRSVRWLLALGCLPLFAAAATAAEASSAILPANIVLDFCADRARLMQVTVVAVALGIAMLCWRK